MKIIIDTREKKHAIKHITDYFDRHEIEWQQENGVTNLNVGDYLIEGKPDLVIDRKQNLSELAHNLVGKDHARFMDEVRRARRQGIRLIILCEHGGIHGLKDVMQWKPKYGKVSGKKLADEIFRLEIAYSVPVLYCDKRSTGKRIVEILNSASDQTD